MMPGTFGLICICPILLDRQGQLGRIHQADSMILPPRKRRFLQVYVWGSWM